MRTWEVTNKDASGIGSLSWAILQANAYAEDNPDVEQQIRFVAPEEASPNEDGTSFGGSIFRTRFRRLNLEN